LYPQSVTGSLPERIFTATTDGRKVWYTDQFGVLLAAPEGKNFAQAASPLGIDTKSHPTPDSIRFERYSLQAEAKKLLPSQRVSGCLFRRISKTSGVSILFNRNRNQANYGNLARCGSGWVCPVCAAKISEHRKSELKQAITYHKTSGGFVFLLTLTNSHNVSDSLMSLKLGQRKAMKHFFANRQGVELFDLLGKIGHVNAYEVTHGSNGWHPHHHILVFVKKDVDFTLRQEIKKGLAIHWVECCRKAKLPLPDLQHGLDLQDGSYADAYVGKWGLEDEMTKGHIKKGKQGGRTPFDLLRASRDGDVLGGKLFQEFAIVFKGSRQLVWSRGLKKSLLITDDKSDQEVVEETEKESEKMLELDVIQWFAIRGQEQRANLLKSVENDLTLVNARALIDRCVMAEIERIQAMLN
jgi:hypothetical protein